MSEGENAGLSNKIHNKTRLMYDDNTQKYYGVDLSIRFYLHPHKENGKPKGESFVGCTLPQMTITQDTINKKSGVHPRGSTLNPTKVSNKKKSALT